MKKRMCETQEMIEQLTLHIFIKVITAAAVHTRRESAMCGGASLPCGPAFSAGRAGPEPSFSLLLKRPAAAPEKMTSLRGVSPALPAGSRSEVRGAVVTEA